LISTVLAAARVDADLEGVKTNGTRNDEPKRRSHGNPFAFQGMSSEIISVLLHLNRIPVAFGERHIACG
jgi:hypothetical protein